MSHLEVRQEKDLSEIRRHISTQAEAVSQAVEHALHAVYAGNHRLAYETVLADHPVNRHTREIDRLCHSFIAVHLPSGGPLRLISSIIRANLELERIGDYATIIAREAVRLNGPPRGVAVQELERIAGETLLMLRQSVKAFKALNADLAKGTMGLGEQLEHNLDLVYEALMANDAPAPLRDTLAIFVIFNQLKRVADQAKNLCEHTVFAATGEQKAPKVYQLLFLDRANDRLGPLAAALGAGSFSRSGLYSTAGNAPATRLDPELIAFLERRGLSVADRGPRALIDITHQELSDKQVILCLEGTIRDYLETVPFHSSVLEWPLDPSADLETLYRELAPRIRDLMELLCGKGAT